MTAKKLEMMRAMIPAVVREQSALTRRTFTTEKQAERAARAFYSRYPDAREPLWLVSHLVGQLVKRTVFFMKRGKVVRGLAVIHQEEAAA